jgi:hypothetical protein
MPVSGLTTGSNITAAQFNELVSLYNAYWQGGSYTWDANHNLANSVRQKGWGQPAVIPTVGASTVITAEHTNYLISQINAGLWHIEEDVSTLQVKRSASTSVSATVYNQLDNVYTSVIDTKKFNIDPSSKNVTTNLVTTSNSSTPWKENIHSEHKFSFADYNEARHFFNSGGELIVDMSSSTGGTNNPSLVWNIFFDNLGLIRIGANSTTNDGDGDGDTPFNSTGGQRGFYTMTGTTTYHTMYDVVAQGDGGGDSDSGGGYGSQISSGLYSSRRFQIQLAGIQAAGAFEVHMKIKLVEDPDDLDIEVNANIIVELGHAQPLATPTPSESSTHDYFSPAAGIDYVFQERNAPIITNTVSWTETGYSSLTVNGY